MAKWDKITTKGRIDDRRATGPIAIGGLGGAGLLIGIVILALNFFTNPDSVSINDVLAQLQQTQVSKQNVDVTQFEGQDSYEIFASTVLGSNNDLWRKVFQDQGSTYTDPTLVLFRNSTRSGCGSATSAVGPHYCPIDESIYLDETFFDELQNRFGAKGGDVAEAYVISHEVAHHVQNQLGVTEQVQQARSQDEANDLSIKLELQADCFAGVWAYSVSQLGIFEQGEINEAINAASAVGDDRVQEKTTGQVNPETWTHGSSEQRVSWFNTGFRTGQPSTCNTFN